MSDKPEMQTIELTPEMLIAVNRLITALGREKFLQLARLLVDAQDHGYGDVKIVIVDHYVRWLRVEKSFE